MRSAVLFVIASLLGAHGVLADPVRAAFFGVSFVDMSLGAEQAEEERRAEMIAARAAEMLEASGRFEFVDTAPVAADAARYGNLARCNGCAARFAARLGAEVAIAGEVHKTSNLILHMGFYIRDAETGALVGGGSADIRGNTDESWRRGVEFIVEKRLLGG